MGMWIMDRDTCHLEVFGRSLETIWLIGYAY
jgi:hypothetical protein